MKMRNFSVIYCTGFWLLVILLKSAFVQVTVEVRTQTYHGMHFPKNAVALWIQTPAPEKKFIRTLRIWGKESNYQLKFWREANEYLNVGWFDGITEATRDNHDSLLSIPWDLTDSNDLAVPNGVYEFWAEMSEDDYHWCQIDPNEEYLGKAVKGTIAIDGVKKTVDGDNSTNEFSDFKAHYVPVNEIIVASKTRQQINLQIIFNVQSRILTFMVKDPIKEFTIEAAVIIDLRGKEIARLPSFKRKTIWNCRDKDNQFVSSGVYFLRISMQTIRKDESFLNNYIYPVQVVD